MQAIRKTQLLCSWLISAGGALMILSVILMLHGAQGWVAFGYGVTFLLGLSVSLSWGAFLKVMWDADRKNHDK